VIGLPLHGRQNSKKFGDEIPAPRSPLPAHVLAFPFCATRPNFIQKGQKSLYIKW
jgi:hypothetical protein